MHYLNRHNILVLKVLSKFELRRLCRVVQATPLARLGAPTPEEAGYVDVCETIEVGGDRVTVLRQEPESAPSSESVKNRTATVVLRGATQNHLDDLERAIDDGVSALKALLKDPRLVPGAGATELALARKVETYGAGLRGLAQHAVRRFATALEVVPRTLAENARGGSEGNEVVARLLAKHEKEGGQVWGVDVEVNLIHPCVSLLIADRSCGVGRDGRHVVGGRREYRRFPRGQGVGDQARDGGCGFGSQRGQHHHEPTGGWSENPAAGRALGQR